MINININKKLKYNRAEKNTTIKTGNLGAVNRLDLVPNSRTLTINGIDQDLNADRSWNVGTVKSVETGEGLKGEITTNGVLEFDTDWGDARYLKRDEEIKVEGIVLVSPDNSRWLLSVDDSGNLVTTAL
ncbi:hypothetical protein MM239_17250 [Belliella sp. DSM 111904]|uniref:Uncharacterized protein n=1 Tax=Belliella filtrata TaxID=2923435 RepID=A0ABS9V446_9BACT|nr:hypothetical protein [Belliella filtrata]MCH7411148.1 hypothetical protein [Belliella filtrata]